MLAYLPVVVPPVVAVLLWKFFYDPRPEGVFNTILGWVGLRPVPVAGRRDAGDAVARARGHLGGRRRHGDHLPRRARRACPPSCTTPPRSTAPAIWRKVWHVTMPQLRGVLLITLILQIIGTAQVFLEPYLFTDGGPDNATADRAAAACTATRSATASARLRRGDRAQPDARRVPRRLVRCSTSASPEPGAVVTHRPAPRRRPSNRRRAVRRPAPAGRGGASADGARRSPQRCELAPVPDEVARAALVHGTLLVAAGRRRAGPAAAGWRSRRSPPRRTRCANRWRCGPNGHRPGEPARRPGTTSTSKPVLLEHGGHRARVVVTQMVVATTGGLRCCRCCARGSPECSTGSCWRPCSFPPSCCSCRCT